MSSMVGLAQAVLAARIPYTAAGTWYACAVLSPRGLADTRVCVLFGLFIAWIGALDVARELVDCAAFITRRLVPLSVAVRIAVDSCWLG
jgi:hypothetical protein